MKKMPQGMIDSSEFGLITGFEVEEEMEVPQEMILITGAGKPGKAVKPVLREWGGLYSIEDGSETVEKAIKSGKKTINSTVIRMYPTGMRLPEEKWCLEMERRKEAGLWDGDLIFQLDENGEFAGGTAIVLSFDGIWVLTKNMERVKKIYQDAEASGDRSSIRPTLPG